MVNIVIGGNDRLVNNYEIYVHLDKTRDVNYKLIANELSSRILNDRNFKLVIPNKVYTNLGGDVPELYIKKTILSYMTEKYYNFIVERIEIDSDTILVMEDAV